MHPPERVLVIGAQRCGTTYLHHVLDGHPDIAMARPVRPEPKVFLTDDVTGDAGAYDARLFAGAPPARVRGEKATSYLERPDALDRIVRTFPGAHLVVAVRDPVERALSNYRFTVDAGLEDRSPDAALLADLDGEVRAYDHTRISVSPFAYVRRGRYVEQLREVDARFPAAQVHVVVYEEVIDDPGAVRPVYDALGLDPTPAPEPAVAGTVVNASVAPATLSAATTARLRDHFADATAALERRLGRALPAWH